MSTTPTLDGQKWRELARVIEVLSAQVQSLTDTGNRETERVTGLEQVTRQVQEAFANLAHRQGTGAQNGGERHEYNALVGKIVVPEGLANKPVFKQWGPRYKLVAGGKDEWFKTLLGWAEGHDTNAPTVAPEASNGAGAAKLAQHLYASLLMSKEAGTEAHSIAAIPRWRTAWRPGGASYRDKTRHQRMTISIS